MNAVPVAKASNAGAGNIKRGSIIILLTSCLTGLELAVWPVAIFVFICKTDLSKPVKQEVNSAVILPSLVFPCWCFRSRRRQCKRCLTTLGTFAEMKDTSSTRHNVTLRKKLLYHWAPGASVNLPGPQERTPLMLACAQPSMETLVDTLLNYEGDPCQKDVLGWTALEWA